MKIKHIVLTLGLNLLAGTSAFAHHSFSATFQEDARITQQGKVTKVVFKNPHVLIYFNVENADGSLTQWVGEGSSVISMRRLGWSSETVKSGDMVRIYGDSTHDGSPMISLEGVWSLDSYGEISETLKGDEAEGGRSPFEAPVPTEYHDLPLTLNDGKTPNFEAVWSNRLSAQTDGARLPPLPYSEAGKARKAAFDVRHDLQVFCDLPGAFRQIFQNPYPLTLIQGEDMLTIKYEEYGVTRKIPFAQAPLDTGIKTRLGTSAARYEDGELVVETINILENPGTTNGDYVSDEARIVERFRRGDDDTVGAIIEIDATVHDPVYLTEPYIVSRRKSITSGYNYTPHECESPLRERTVVSPYMSLFALEGAESNEQCREAAETVGQGEKGWTLATGALPGTVYYDATGEYLETKNTMLSVKGTPFGKGVSNLSQCYATENFIAPVSSQTTPNAKSNTSLVDTQKSSKQGGGKNWIFLLGALILGGIVMTMARRKT